MLLAWGSLELSLHGFLHHGHPIQNSCIPAARWAMMGLVVRLKALVGAPTHAKGQQRLLQPSPSSIPHPVPENRAFPSLLEPEHHAQSLHVVLSLVLPLLTCLHPQPASQDLPSINTSG